MTIKRTGSKKALGSLKKFMNVIENTDTIVERVANLAADEVKIAHGNARGVDHIISKGHKQDIVVVSDASVTVERKGRTFQVVATGKNFMFFEFGAGVKRNRPRDWENKLAVPVPSGISPIGQYGKKQGSNQSWRYLTDAKLTAITGGYAAVGGFAIAINSVVANVDKIIKGVANE